MSRDVELVIFDLGRVLCRICDGWEHACEVAGVARPAKIDAEQHAKLHEIICAVEVANIGPKEFVSRGAAIIGIPVEHVQSLWDAYTRGPYPGAFELLEELKTAGYRTACLSNTNVNHWQRMEDPDGSTYMGLHRLTYRFASHLVRMRKPNAEIYEHVERTTGASPQGIIFFDDVEENVEASRRRGWRGCQIAIDSDPIAQVRKHLRANDVAVAP